jgi:hypothetical protein
MRRYILIFTLVVITGLFQHFVLDRVAIEKNDDGETCLIHWITGGDAWMLCDTGP